MVSTTRHIEILSFTSARVTTNNGIHEVHLSGPQWCTCASYKHRFTCRHVGEVAHYLCTILGLRASGNGQKAPAAVRG